MAPVEIADSIQSIITHLTGEKFEFKEIKSLQTNSEYQIYVLTETSDIAIPFQKVSEGTLSVLAIFGLIYYYLKALHKDKENVAKRNGIVFIDEIDAHLHPEWQRKVIPLLRNSFPNVQFFITAHSPLVVGGCLEGEVTVLKKETKREGDVEKCFTIHQFHHDFIGWDIPSLYKTVFEVEQLDYNYFYYYGMSLFEGEIHNEIIELENKEKLSFEDEKKLLELYRKIRYINISKEKMETKVNKFKERVEIRKLKIENKRLMEKLKQLDIEGN